MVPQLQSGGLNIRLRVGSPPVHSAPPSSAHVYLVTAAHAAVPLLQSHLTGYPYSAYLCRQSLGPCRASGPYPGVPLPSKAIVTVCR